MTNVITNAEVLRMTDPRTTGNLFTLMASRTVNARKYGGTMTYGMLWRKDAQYIATLRTTYRSTWD